MTDTEKLDLCVALIAWQLEMGVDAAQGEAPVDWQAQGDAAPGHGFRWPSRSGEPALEPPAPPRALPPHAAPPSVTPRAAPPRPLSPTPPPSRQPGPTTEPALRAEIARASDLAALEALLKDFDGCPLKATAKSLCFYRGTPQARLMIIGEAPGRDEDLAGRPFVGRAGQLLDRMLAAIGLGEADVHITNTVYWRPPGNRTPTPQETLACRPFLERQIDLVAPEIILTLGGPASKVILDVSEGIMRVRGSWRTLDRGGRKIRVLPTLHPAYLLRSPDAKRLAWRDLRALKAAFTGP